MRMQLALVSMLAVLVLLFTSGCRLGAAAGVVKTKSPGSDAGTTKEVKSETDAKTVRETTPTERNEGSSPKGSEVEAERPDVPPIPIVYLLIAG